MEIVKNGTILFVCTMVGNVSNYCFQFLMGRTLSIEDFGAMNALLSVMMSVTLPTGAIMFVIAKYVSTYRARGEAAKIGSIYRKALGRIALLAAFISLLFMLSAGWLGNYLRIDDVQAVLILAVGIFGAFVLTVNLGILQGIQRFYYLGAGLGLGGVLRLVLGVLFVLAGLGLKGALLATVLPTLLIFGLTMAPVYPYAGLKGADGAHTRILNYSVPVFLSSAVFAFLSNIDLVMVRHFFDPVEAGLYSSVVVLGKTMLYLPSAFALAMFPMVSEQDALNGDSFRILDRALLCTLALCLAGLAVFVIAPGPLITTLFGARFSGAAHLLKYYGLAMTFMALVSILMSFNLARHRTTFIYSMAAGGVMLVVFINVFHSSIKEVLGVMMSVFFFIAAFNLLQVYRERQVFYRLRGAELPD